MQEQYELQVIPVTSFQQNAMIFWSKQSMKGVLVDPGGEVERLMDAIKETGVQIVAIWLTHGHIDHAAAAAECRRRLECEIIGPNIDDQFWLDQLESMAAKYQIEGAENFTPDRYLHEGDTAELDGLVFEIIHCPGHSPGSVVFYSKELSFAFIGDVLFQGSVGRTDLPRGNQQQLIDAITGKLWPLGDQVQFMPGHGPGSTFHQERQSNAFVADSVTGYPSKPIT